MVKIKKEERIFKNDKLGIISLVLALIGWSLYGNSPTSNNTLFLIIIFGIIPLCLILSIIFGAKALKQIKKNKNLKKEEKIIIKVIAILGITISSWRIFHILLQIIEGVSRSSLFN